MSNIKYTDKRLGKLRVIPDFRPSPSEFAFREDGVKVTISLSRKSVDFFKAEARKHNTQYQRMIRRLLDTYAEQYLRSSDASERTRERQRTLSAGVETAQPSGISANRPAHISAPPHSPHAVVQAVSAQP